MEIYMHSVAIPQLIISDIVVKWLTRSFSSIEVCSGSGQMVLKYFWIWMKGS